MSILSYIRSMYRASKPAPAPVDPPPVHRSMVTQDVYGQIQALKSQADWMGELLEDAERDFVYGEDGTVQFGQHAQVGPQDQMFGYWWAYQQSLYRPGYGACFCINEVQHRMIRARSRAFCSVNPYWHGVQHNLQTHVVGTGHRWTPVSRTPLKKPAPDEMLAGCRKELDDFYACQGYRSVQLEKCNRKSRDGEYFLSLKEKDGYLQVRFIEPLLVWSPPGKSERDDVWFGIQYAGGDYEKPAGYYVRRTDILGGDNGGSNDAWARMVKPTEIQHRKVNVDRSTPRGIPDTYWVQARLEQSLRTLRAMGMLVQVRSKIALVRKRTNALIGSVTPILSANASAQVAGPGGQMHNVNQYPDGAILDVSDQADYQFPGQNIETDKIIASVQADLQAVATSVGLADYMVSGSLGGSSYATSMVAEGPVVKTFQQHQQDMIDEDMEVATRVLLTAVEAGRLPADTLELVKIEINGPTLTRIDVQQAQANQIKMQCGVLSKTEWQHQEALDPDEQHANNVLAAKQAVELQEILGPQSVGGVGGESTATSDNKPRNKQGATSRPFSPDQEPRQIQRSTGGTKEEHIEEQYATESGGGQKPTLEDLAMADQIFPMDWLLRVKTELALLSPPMPADNFLDEYAPGIRACFLGTADGQRIYAVDLDALVVQNNAPELRVAGRAQRWPFLQAGTVVVDRAYCHLDEAQYILHELAERVLMNAGWSHARAHRYANTGPGMAMDYMMSELRPELAGLKPLE